MSARTRESDSNSVPIVIEIVALSNAAKKQKVTKLQQGINSQGGKFPPRFPEQRNTGYQVTQPTPPSETHGIAPQQISVNPDAHLLEPIGQVIDAGPSLPSTLNLRARWAQNQVTLDWDQLSLGAGYQLDGYVVSAMQYGPVSTAPVKALVAQLPLGSTQFQGAFNQTYKWNTSGDLEGYVVDALVRRTTSEGYVEVLRLGGMSYVPKPPLL